MIRLFHDNNIDFLGHKSVLILVSVALLLLGCASVLTRGFNLGVDFVGGTLVYARFINAPTSDQIREALAAQGVDSSQVIIQPIARSGSGREGLLIRLPHREGGDDGEIDAGRRRITRALAVGSGPEAGEPGKININSASAAELAVELRQLGLDPSVDAAAVAEKIVADRDAQPTGLYQSLDPIRQIPDLPAPAVEFVTSNFYAGKLDINSTGSDTIRAALVKIDPLGLKGDPAAAETQYAALSSRIISYRDGAGSGLVTSIDELPLDEYAPELRDRLKEHFFTGNFNIENLEQVGAQVGEDLTNRAIYVTLASLIGMLVYIAARFELIYGVSAVLAVFHDVLVALGLFSLFQWEINLTVVAGLLTLVGYSVNDTIVIFDRIRENTRLHRRDSIEKITNDAINQTMSRTIISNGTAFATALVLVLFGGDVLKSFSVILFLGIVVGTYSTIAIASPIMLWWQMRHRSRRAQAPTETDRPAREGTRVARTAKTV
jgi:preprotein translocase SecF subunit